MAINDMVGKVLRPLGLMAALYGCGDSSDFCKEYNRQCPGISSTDLAEITAYCRCSGSPGDQPDEDCAFIACAVETGYCDNEVKGDPQIMECAKNYGWDVGN